VRYCYVEQRLQNIGNFIEYSWATYIVWKQGAKNNKKTIRTIRTIGTIRTVRTIGRIETIRTIEKIGVG
jgi:hypothetical protein